MGISFFIMGMLIIFWILFTIIVQREEDETDRNRSLSKDKSLEQKKDMTLEEIDQILTDSDREQIRKLKLDGTQVIAMKYVRDHAKCSLVSARNYVEHFEEPSEFEILKEEENELYPNSYLEREGNKFRSEDFQQMVLLKNKGKIVNAIQIVRQKSGWGLKEAKEFIDHLYTGKYEDLPNSSKELITKIMENSQLSDPQMAAIIFVQVQSLKENQRISEAENMLGRYTSWNAQQCKIFVEEI